MRKQKKYLKTGLSTAWNRKFYKKQSYIGMYMGKLPELKKKVTSYLLSEEGKISKQSLMALGAFLGGAAISSILMADSVNAHSSSQTDHDNSLKFTYSANDKAAIGKHNHHSSHGSHDSY